MKKIFLAAAFFGAAITGQTQITLNYESHALLPETQNLMVISEYMNPGANGENVTWDFSDMKITKDFEGTLADNRFKSTGEFDEANTELHEFNNLFYFDVGKNRMLEYGVTNTQKSYTIKYDTPPVKMVYPFEYGRSETGLYSGEYRSENVSRQIEGNYEVTADGYGTLILPDVTVENTLRVKSVKDYTRTYGDHSTNIVVVTYRWYNAFERFPLLVLTEITTQTKSNTNIGHQAAYKNIVNLGTAADIERSKQAASVKVFPNPADKTFTVSLDASLNENYRITIYDLSGKLIHKLESPAFTEGNQEITFNVADLNLAQGTYLLKIKSKNFMAQPLLVIE